MPIFTRRLSRGSQRGFTLIELLVVILVIGILVAIAAPSFLGHEAAAKDSVAEQHVTIALKDSRFAYTSSNAQSFGTSASLAAAIKASEPQFQTQAYVANTPSTFSTGPTDISAFVSPDGQTADVCAQSLTQRVFCWRYATYAGLTQVPEYIAQVGGSPFVSTAYADGTSSPTQARSTGGNEALARAALPGIGGATGAHDNVKAAVGFNSVIQPVAFVPLSGPAATVNPVISGNATIGQTLSTSTGTWTGNPAPTTFTYQWRDCNSAGGSCADVASGGTASSFTVTSGDVGYTLRVVVTATNTQGSASATATQSDIVPTVEASGNLVMTDPITYVAHVATSASSTLTGSARANGSVALPSIFTNPNISATQPSAVTWRTSYTGPTIALTDVSQAGSAFTRAPISVSAGTANCSAGSCSAILGAPYNAATNTYTLASGTATLAPGDYVFCNFSATGGTVTANPTSTTPVRIFIDSPHSARCSGNGLGSAQGNFVATKGIGNTLGATLGVAGAAGLQVYVVGDGGGYDNATSVTVGPTALVAGAGVAQNYVIYAPTSVVSLNNCTSVVTGLPGLLTGGDVCGAIRGEVMGDNVTIKTSQFTG